MVKSNIKQCLSFLQNDLIISIVNASNHTKCVSNEKCTSKPTLINLHPNEYSQRLHYCPFAVNLEQAFSTWLQE